jgi:hypothetical protein
LNFVAYAEDAVSFIYWSKFNGATTDAASCLSTIGAKNVSAELLKNIWNGVDQTWNQLDPSCTSTNHIYAYWAMSGSGTESTWASATGASFPKDNNDFPTSQIIFENETASILKNNATAPVGDSIFFFSYGDYIKQCTPDATTLASTNAVCAGTSTKPKVKNTVQLGTEINGITLSKASINAQLPGQANEFPGDRLLYNVYADGFNPNLPASAPAALNIVSEDGFLCKPSTATDIDPNTGSTYRSEIDAAIEAQGFFPLPLQVEDGQGDTTVAGYNSTAKGIPNPAWNDGLSASKYNAANETASPYDFAAANTDTDDSAISGTYKALDGSSTATSVQASATAPVGYCLTETSDGSTAGQ